LLTLRNVRVNSDSLLFKNLRVLPHSFVNAADRPEYKKPRFLLRFFIRNYLRRKVTKFNKDCLWFINSWSENYFHWMADAIPRLFAARGRLANATVLLPFSYEHIEYVKSSLRAFGTLDLTFIPENEVFSLENLILPTETAMTGNYNDDLIRKVREFYAQYYSYKKPLLNFGDKIYISRSRASKRRILNENELVALLREYNFHIVHFEDFSFDEQVNIALNTKYLISNHGAGLTNMLFMNPGNFVLELRKEGDTHGNCYFSLASALDLNYLYQTCRPENADEHFHSANVIVDSELLRDNIELMLGYRRIQRAPFVGSCNE